MKFDLTKKTIMTVSLLALVALGIMFGIFYPTIKYIKKTSDDALQLRQFLEQKYQQSLQNRITRKKLEEIKSSYVDFLPYLFKIDDDLKYIGYLDAMASKHKLVQNITSSNFDNAVNHQVSVNLNLSGKYRNLVEYMADLEGADYFINIQNLQITPVFERNGEPTNQANLSLTVNLYVNNK